MNAVKELQNQYAEFLTSLCNEGILDGHFLRFHEFQEEGNPAFVNNVVSIFLTDSGKILSDLATALEQENFDYKKIYFCLQQLKGCSSCIGARRVHDSCVAFISCCDAKNAEGCFNGLKQVKEEHSLVQDKLRMLVKLEQQITAAGGAIPIEEVIDVLFPLEK